MPTGAKTWPIDPFNNQLFVEKGVRKITTGITGWWRIRVQIDCAF